MTNIFLNRLKLLILLFLTSITIFIKQWFILFFLLFFLVISTLLFKPKKKLLTRIYPLLFIAFLVILFQAICNTSVSFSTRIINGATAALKIITLSMLVFFYTSTTSPSEIVTTFSFLPKKLQLMLTITFSLIPAILEEAQKIILIQNARGINSRSLNPAKSIFPIIIPLLHRTLKRAEQIAVVSQARGYDEG